MHLDMNDLTSTLDVMNDLDLDAPEAGRYVYAVVRRIVRDPDDAADVAQDALVLAHRHRAAFRGDSSYRTWLYRIATTAALGHLRKRRRSREQLAASDEPVGAGAADPGPAPDAALERREAIDRVQRAIAALGVNYRSVMQLRADDVSEAEIASRLGVTVANVKIRAFRARAQLRETLLAS